MFRNNGWKKLSAMLLSCSLLTFSLTACGSSESDSLDLSLVVPEEANYQTVEVEPSDFTSAKSIHGTVVYLDSAELTVTESGAKFGEFLVDRDQEVQEGDDLFTYTVEGSHADLTEKQLELQETKDDYTRQVNTLNSQLSRAYTTLKACTKGSTEYQITSCNIQLLQSQLNQLELDTDYEEEQLQKEIEDLEETLGTQTVKAPFDGTITMVGTIHEGDLIEDGTTLIYMRSDERALLQLDSDAAFRYGDKVQISAGLLTGENGFSGTVVSSGRILPGKVTDRYTYIMLDDEEDAGRLMLARDNLMVTADEVRLSDVLVLPKDAVNETNDSYSVTLLNEGTLEHRYVTIGAETQEEVWVVGGLEEGQSAVLE